MSDKGKKLSQASDDPLSNRDPNKQEWVKFEENEDRSATTNDGKVFFFCLLKCDDDHEGSIMNDSELIRKFL